MHLYFLMRGNKPRIDEFITELQGKYLPIKLKVDKNGKPSADGELRDMQVQLGVRPVQLYEIAFPKEHKDLVLATVLGKEVMRPEYSKFEKYIKWIRRLIGLKPIEKYDTSKVMPVTKWAIDTIGIGLKDDKEHGFGEGI